MYSEELLVAIRERLDYESVFGEFVELTGRGDERMAFCIFHENTNTPALSINVKEGLYICRNPECGARGDIITFFQKIRSLTFHEAIAELARRVGLEVPDPSTYDTAPRTDPIVVTQEHEEALIKGYTPPEGGAKPKVVSGDKAPIDERLIEKMHTRLFNSPEQLKFMTEVRGLSVDTLQQYQIGHDGDRYYIPVRDQSGACVNIRRYKPGSKKAQYKMISWQEGYGTARLFPIQALSEMEPVYLMEGEMDCLLARQLGLNALTTTSGAGAWKDEWTTLFAGRDVVICYDVDDAGRAGASHKAVKLVEVARSVKVVKLPLSEPVGADFTNYIVDHGMTVKDFEHLVAETPLFHRNMALVGADVLAKEPIHLHLSHASEAQYDGELIRMNVMVSGKMHAPYIVPREVKAGDCGLPGLKMCERCPVNREAGSITKKMEFESNDVLQFIDVTDQQLRGAIKRKLGVPAKCGLVTIENVETMNVEMVQLIPEIERSEQDTPYVTRQAFYLGHGLQTNRSYLVTGVTVPEPKKQFATHLLHTATPSQSNIDSFRLTADVVKRLRSFNPSKPGVEGLREKMDEMYEDLEKITRIYQRRDLMLVTDLMFHSMLTFVFQGDPLVRGWVEALMIGDSRSGKTATVARLFNHYGAGEFASGENTSLAGLVGGLHQVGNSWALQWGRIVLNDRRAIAIDEAGNLPTDQIARMSSMRSSGIAEIVKIHTEKTNARTRQLWLSNPRGNRPLSSYSQGVLAVKELIGAPEDIARFDLVVSAASGDVSLAVVNAPREHEAPDTFTRELCHQRVMWAWSRLSEHVEFPQQSIDAVLHFANIHGEAYRYAMEIPLVEPNEQRIKIARLAASTAAIFFSSDDTGEKVIVKPEHVEFAATFLDELYAKPSMAFDEYGRQARRRYELTKIEDVARIINRNEHAAQGFMEQEKFIQSDLEELLSIPDRQELKKVVTVLRDSGFLKRSGSSFYVKTPAAIRWLREHLNAARSYNGNGNGAHEPVLARTHTFTDGLPDEPDF